MATVYAHTNDGYVTRYNQSSWSNARANTAGTSAVSTGTSYATAVQADRTAARGGGYVFSIRRSFFFFDTSGISADVDSATFKVRGYNQGAGDLKDNLTSSVFPTYISEVGLYDDKNSLVGLARLSKPIPKSTKIPMKFFVRMDY